MMFHLADLDGQFGRQALMDPARSQPSQNLSRLAAKRYELNHALAERRRQRRAAKIASARGRRQPAARTA